MTGIEPALSAWEADVLPLNYIRKSAEPAGTGSRAALANTCYRNSGLVGCAWPESSAACADRPLERSCFAAVRDATAPPATTWDPT
jgi:hypothetical protein